MSHNNKAQTLGMPHGTANHRLRKAIMFKYVILAGDNFCFKCGAEIESVDDLSVEHKEPWEGVSADLFFDLNNIAFSHIKCNRPHKQSTWARIPTPDGHAWCSTCQMFLPVESFYKDKNRWDGLNKQCKSCHKTTRERTRRVK